MATILTPYLNFRDSTREAMEFYHSALGGDLTMSTFGEFGMSEDPDEQGKIMHSQLRTDGGLVLMAADVPQSMEFIPGNNLSVSLSGDDTEELTGYYNALSAGGNVIEPLAMAPWGDSFGMFLDKFGVSWLVNIAGTPS